MQPLLNIHSLSAHQLPHALNLVKSVNWNQTPKDLQLFLQTGNSYLAAQLDNKLVGTVASIVYDQKVAWISMMIVAKAYRAQGISKHLLQRIIQKLQKSDQLAIKLDATPSGRPVYQKLGFREEYIIHRFIHPNLPKSKSPFGIQGIRKMNEADRSTVLDLDEEVFGANRNLLFERLHEENQAYVLENGGKLQAYLFGRQGRRFFHLGPLGALDSNYAEALVQYALQKLDGKAVAIDLLDDKESLKSYFQTMDFQIQRSFYRMYLGNNPYPGKKKWHYLIAGPEFG